MSAGPHDPDPSAPHSAFRHEAPDLGAGIMARPRLVDAVRGRFERRLTVVRAGAGFGKTTLLAQAVRENQLERLGRDVWLHVGPADRDPAHLLAGMARSLGGAVPPSGADVDDLVEMVWSAAPESIAFLLDDTHELDGAPPAWDALRALLERLPSNGHLVLAGRTPVALPVARLLAADMAVVIDEEALAFTADEREAFGVQRQLSPELVAELPPWPAIAALTTAVGHGASTDYLWEEVLSTLPAERRDLLARAAAFDLIDDLIVDALAPDGGWSASRLVEGLPLVVGDGRGAHRLHSLWSDALDGLLGPAVRAEALRAGAEALLRAGSYSRAAEAFAAAGDDEGLHRAIRRFAAQPITSVTVPDVAHLLDLLTPELRAAPIGSFLDAARHWASSARQAAVLFQRTIDLASVAGDTEIESIAWWRLVQLRYLDEPGELEVVPRMEELARSGVPLGASTPAFVRSVQHQRAGRIEDALAAIEHFEASDPDQRFAAQGWRLIDLGRPEGVPGTVESVLDGGRIDLIGAQAVWLRGEVDPDLAWLLASGFPGIAGRKGVAHEQASIRAVVALVAVAAGDFDGAAQLLAAARQLTDLVGRQVQLIVEVAEAVLALCVEDEPAAVRRFDAVVAKEPLGAWPTRGYLLALASLRSLAPGAEALDGCALGPTLRVAVEAGRAIVVARGTGSVAEAVALPWSRPDLLRSHVPPPLLVELGVIATAGGVEAARALVGRLPRQQAYLRRVIERYDGPIGAAARELLGDLPLRPPYDLEVRTLGGFSVVRSDGTPVAGEWDRRERVRAVMAQLVIHRRVRRSDLAAALWPDLPVDRAAANLRTNLRHLHAALQPDRPADVPAWFVRGEGDELVLAGEDEGLTVDADRFDAKVAAAVRAEAAGMPSKALTGYEAASRLAVGDFLPGIDDHAVEMERMRLRSLAHAADCRRGELVLARGEPETAMRIAVATQRLDPLSERAHRLFIRCHLALGSTSEARTAGRHLRAQLGRAGLQPEDETALLFRRLQLPPAAPEDGPDV